MNFADLQNAVLQRLRMKGPNWGGSPTNSSTDLVPPYRVKLELNKAYNNFLSATKNFPITTLRVKVGTAHNAPSLPLVPLPSFGATMNPAVMQVYEMTYTPSGGQEQYTPFVSTTKFRDLTAGYRSRLGQYGPWPDYVSQRFGQRIIDMFPGTANAYDHMHFMVCPDPIATSQISAAGGYSGIPPNCAQGGIMTLDTDIPLIPAEYHEGLVAGAVLAISKDLDKKDIREEAQSDWDRYIDDAVNFGSTVAEGDAEQQVGDFYGQQAAFGDDVL